MRYPERYAILPELSEEIRQCLFGSIAESAIALFQVGANQGAHLIPVPQECDLSRPQ